MSTPYFAVICVCSSFAARDTARIAAASSFLALTMSPPLAAAPPPVSACLISRITFLIVSRYFSSSFSLLPNSLCWPERDDTLLFALLSSSGFDFGPEDIASSVFFAAAALASSASTLTNSPLIPEIAFVSDFCPMNSPPMSWPAAARAPSSWAFSESTLSALTLTVTGELPIAATLAFAASAAVVRSASFLRESPISTSASIFPPSSLSLSIPPTRATSSISFDLSPLIASRRAETLDIPVVFKTMST